MKTSIINGSEVSRLSVAIQLVVKPASEEQERIFREVHQQRKLDSVMPFGGKREVKDIDKSIENPGYDQPAVPVQAPVYTARMPTRMK